MNRVGILFAILAVSWAADQQNTPVKANDQEKQGGQQGGQQGNQQGNQQDQVEGLDWPLPDPDNEGDLMQFGALMYERVEELRTRKPENDVEKMILDVGRNYLRLAHKFLEANADFKIPAVLCEDSRSLNATRWSIRAQPEKDQQAKCNNQEQCNQQQQNDQQQQQKQQQQQNDAQTKQGQQQQPQNDAPNKQQQQQQQSQNDAPIKQGQSAKQGQGQQTGNNNNNKNQNDIDLKQGLNVTNEQNDTESDQPIVGYELQRNNFYQQMGDNFARLLMKHFQNEKLDKAENEYIQQWNNEQAVHYGVMGIYCQQGENVKEIVKKMAAYIEEKQ